MSPVALDYNTSEAIPNTVYYRSTGQEGKARPSLEALRLGKPTLNEQDQVWSVSHLATRLGHRNFLSSLFGVVTLIMILALAG